MLLKRTSRLVTYKVPQLSVAEVWGNIQNDSNVTLWCDGLKVRDGASKRKQAQETYSDEEESPPSKRRREDEDRVQKIVDELKRWHGEKFTTMQYRIWAEMKKSGVHYSTSEPPITSMFTHAGTGGSTSESTKKITPDVSVALNQIASALSPKPASKSATVQSSSPAKLIENRTKCFKQLAELKHLKYTEILSEEEYRKEREAVMKTLKVLNVDN